MGREVGVVGRLSSSSCGNSTSNYRTMALSGGVAMLCSSRPLGVPVLRRRGNVNVLKAGRVDRRRCEGERGGRGVRWLSFPEKTAGTGRKCSRSRSSGEGGGVCHRAFLQRFYGLQLGRRSPVFSRKNEQVEAEPQRINHLESKTGLWWESFGKDVISGHGGECQIQGDESFTGHNFSSKIFKMSLICSLCLGSAWFAPLPALASRESFDASGHQKFSNALESKGLNGELVVQLIDARASTAAPQSGPQFGNPQPRLLFSLGESSEACEESYGFLPCSRSVGGNVFLIIAYGYFLLLAAQLISKGSELLLEVMNAGLLGGLLLPILGALPDALLVLVSGVGGTALEAQEQVMVGVGVLAGSIVMLLTVGWAGSLYAGRCDLSGPGGTAVDRKLTPSLDWTRTGVTTDEQTRFLFSQTM